MEDLYELEQGYAVNRYRHFDDTRNADEWQRGVYDYARRLMDARGWRSVLDVGCGSAYKLATMFEGLKRTGTEVEPTLAVVRERYPDIAFEASDFSKPMPGRHDVVVCADVIEHLVEPGALVAWLAAIDFGALVISTPDRERGAEPAMGPPTNVHHVREWTLPQFRRYIGRRFRVVDQRVYGQSQMIHAERR